MTEGSLTVEIVFTNPGVDYMIRQIIGFQNKEKTTFWSDSLYYFFPELDKAYTSTLPLTEKKKHIDRVLRKIYIELEDTINEKTMLYSQHWKSCRVQISDALSDAFDTDCCTLFNDLNCNISMNPISPRFLEEHSFDVFYLNSERGAIGSSIHEIIHFMWFYVWNDLFGDSYDEYEHPSLKWILSEMVVESVMKDPRLSSINPYFPREQGGCIYPYFFDMVVNDSLILDTLDEMYRSQSIREFMKTSFAYCQQHESEIRAHIKKSESKL